MPPRRLVPPPEKATWADAYRFGLGLLMVILGITILVRSYSANALTFLSVLMGLTFVAFGLYRLYVGIVRYRIYRGILKNRQKD